MSEVISELHYRARRALTLNAEIFTQEALALLRQNNDPTAELWQLLFKANRLRYVNASQASDYLREALHHDSYSAGTLVAVTMQHMQFLIDSEHAPFTDRMAGLDRFRSKYLDAGFAFGDAIVDLQVGYAFINANQPADALRLYQQALAKFEMLGDELMVAEAKSQIAHALFIAGFDHGADDSAFKQCLQLLGEVQEVYTRYDVPMWTVDVLHSIANLHFVMNDYASALSISHQALAICERVARELQTINQRMETTNCMSQIAMIHVKARNLDTARTYALAALDLCPTSHPEAYGECLERLGVIEKWEGNEEQALEYYQKAIALADEHGMQNKPIRHLNLAHCLLMLGRVDEARVAADLAIRSPLFVGHQTTAWASIVRAQILMKDGEIDTAKKLVDEYLERNTNDINLWEQIEAHLVLRDVAQQQSNFAEYVHHNERVVTLTDQLRGTKKLQGLTMKEHERSVEGEREEARRHKAILYSTLPKNIADRVARGETINDHYDNAAVLFADVVGFTSHSSNMPASDVVQLLARIFTSFDKHCDTHNVVKVKTIGDSYMCFKADATATDNANALASVANAMQRETFTWPDNTPIQFRIGMHIGAATAGVIGTDRLQYDVWGDTVNVASRMESTGEPNRIHISHAFREAVAPGAWHVEPRGKTDIKGKGMLTTYWLNDRK